MHFIFSDEVVLLFDFWSVHSPAGMALSVLVVLFLAVLYESIKVGKAKLLHQAVVSVSVLSSQQLTEETDQDSSASDSAPVSRARLSDNSNRKYVPPSILTSTTSVPQQETGRLFCVMTDGRFPVSSAVSLMQPQRIQLSVLSG
ncbi:probable low affinity copper uptake protein 2 isoform X1 [Panthera pardus]|uniref:Copper transport protein n=1 Tax=Panthera pardus TaxID=9691 RepID=A0A9V1FUU4_PANPR|nr:probable low affinity copper uptake protein 2 isoform X1 [Panthera pardus]XP_060464955.1 protein SLC31A2 isoform X1 [Panthera onca]XP_060464956.1 protein SLC31A2 isoform X1 [Panthera onca]